jgi:YHS domain-containing protein
MSVTLPRVALWPERVVRKSIQEDTLIWVEQGAADSRINLDKNGVIVKGYDAVAYFSENKAVKGSSKYESLYQRAKHYFSSATNQAIFGQNASKYVPQYGAFCADGLLKGNLEDIDPTVFFSRQKNCTSARPRQS